MYSIIIIDKTPTVVPAEYVHPTDTILAYGIKNKHRANEILNRIKDKQNKQKQNEKPI